MLNTREALASVTGLQARFLFVAVARTIVASGPLLFLTRSRCVVGSQRTQAGLNECVRR